MNGCKPSVLSFNTLVEFYFGLVDERNQDYLSIRQTAQGDDGESGNFMRACTVLRTWEFKGQEEILLSRKTLSFSPLPTVFCLIHQNEIKSHCVLNTCYNPGFALKAPSCPTSDQPNNSPGEI